MAIESLCSLKGCKYKATVRCYLYEREIRLCPKHKPLVYIPLMNWSVIKK